MKKFISRRLLKNYALSFLLSIPLLILLPSQAGWSPAIYRSICLDTLKLMPPSLRGILQLHEKELLRGVQHQSYSSSQLIQLLEKESNQIIFMIGRKEKFSRICFQFGLLCRLASDVNNPLFIASKDPQESLYYSDFIALTEINQQKFVLTFEGYDRNLLEENQLNHFIKNILDKSEELYPFFRRFMLSQGFPIEASTFTPRSIPFALASICYCRAVSTTANLWLYCWKKVNGDLSNTPFYNHEKCESE